MMAHKVSDAEREKYERMWAVSDYRTMSPGEQWLPMFLNMARDHRKDDGDRLLDAGCGTGRVGAKLAACGFDVELMDLSDAGLEVDTLRFTRQPLWEPIDEQYEFGIACDVLEHVPQEFTMLTVDNLLQSCDHLFLTVCTEPDKFGARIGEPLHLTVQPFVWWRDRLREIAVVEEARDCMNTAVFYLGSKWD